MRNTNTTLQNDGVSIVERRAIVSQFDRRKKNLTGGRGGANVKTDHPVLQRGTVLARRIFVTRMLNFINNPFAFVRCLPNVILSTSPRAYTLSLLLCTPVPYIYIYIQPYLNIRISRTETPVLTDPEHCVSTHARTQPPFISNIRAASTYLCAIYI